MTQAPVFEIRERPSQWDRRVRAISTLSELAQFRLGILRRAIPPRRRLAARLPRYLRRLRDAGMLSQYLFPSIYVHCRPSRDSDDEVLRQLEPYESRFKVRQIDEGSNHFAGIVLQQDPMTNWATIADWFHEKLVAYRRMDRDRRPIALGADWTQSLPGPCRNCLECPMPRSMRGSAELRPQRVPVGGLLVGVGRAKQGRLPKVRGHELQAHRQAL